MAGYNDSGFNTWTYGWNGICCLCVAVVQTDQTGRAPYNPPPHAWASDVIIHARTHTVATARMHRCKVGRAPTAPRILHDGKASNDADPTQCKHRPIGQFPKDGATERKGRNQGSSWQGEVDCQGPSADGKKKRQVAGGQSQMGCPCGRANESSWSTATLTQGKKHWLRGDPVTDEKTGNITCNYWEKLMNKSPKVVWSWK